MKLTTSDVLKYPRCYGGLMKNIFTQILVLIATLSSMVFFAQKTTPTTTPISIYRIDPAHSSITFKISHLVISKVRGRFGHFSGTIALPSKDPTTGGVLVTIQAGSVDTDNIKRDKHLASPEFFNVAKFPDMTFSSSSVTKTSTGFLLKGILEMHGVRRAVTIPFTLVGPIQDPWGNSRLGAEGHLTIDRRQWGLTYNQALETGGVAIGNDVEIELSIEAVLPKAKPKDTKKAP